MHASVGIDDPEKNELIDIEALSPSDDGLVRVEIPGMVANDMAARFMGDTLFIPFTAFCDMLRIKNSTSPDLTSLRGTLPSGEPFAISPASGSATAGTRTVKFPLTSIRMVGGEAFVESKTISSILGISSDFDPVALKLVVYADEKIPLVAAMRRQGKYGALAADPSTSTLQQATISRQLFGAPVINWQLSSSYSPQLNGSYVGGIRLGQQFLFGTLDIYAFASATGNDPKGFSAWLDGASWRYQMPSSPILTQIELGTLNVNQQRAQGISLTNAPLTPREGFSQYGFHGQTQPEWTVELYDGNRLVDVTRADSSGRYQFSIPVGYGTIDRVTKEIGPHGEIVIASHRLQLNQEMLPTGVVEYHAEFGLDSLRTRSAASGRGRVAVGVFESLTVGAEALYRSPDMNQWRADSIAPRAFATAWLGGGTSIGASYDLNSRTVAGEVYSILPSNALFRGGVDSLSLGTGYFATSATATVPVGPITVGGTGRYAKGIWGTEKAIEPQISGYVAGINFIGSTRYTMVDDAPVLSSEFAPLNRTVLTSALRLMVAPTNGLLLSADGRYDHSKKVLSSLDLSAYYRISDYLGINLNYGVSELDWKHGGLQAQITLDLGALHLSTITGYQSGKLNNSSYAQGSVIISRHGVQAYNTPSVGESAIIVEAFNDRNGNGIRDGGEEELPAPATRLMMGGSGLTSEDGVFHALPANRPCVVEIDRWSSASDNLFPTQSSFAIYTMPSGAFVIEVPYAEGFDATGSCRIEGTSSTQLVNGLRVKLVGKGNGSSYDGEIFSDGTVFVAGISAGTYTIVFDADQLEARELAPPTVDTVTLGATQHRIPTIELLRTDGSISK